MKIKGVLQSFRKRESSNGGEFFESIVLDKMQGHRIFFDESLGKLFEEKFIIGDTVTLHCNDSDKGVWIKRFDLPQGKHVEDMPLDEHIEITMRYLTDCYVNGLRPVITTRTKSDGGKDISYYFLSKEDAHEHGEVRFGSHLLPNHMPKIDFCLDKLGVKYVSEELKKIVGDSKNINWSDLVSKKEWVPAYKEKLNELYQQALAKETQWETI